ncbi:MAG TPA: fluoride efflux transporter CrcB [Myxococcota bacterium]|nr:fluoride efflux transporter CrcB [Myxococcota bacterium]HPV05316.1 fluoride efflux transporter CrcB [Myxococcota bacterium]
MKELLLVCLGGGIGTGARFLAGRALNSVAWSWLPVGTILVNIVGSFLLSFIAVFSMRHGKLPDVVVLMLTTGVMGGFTTYSTFNHETLSMIQAGRWQLAVANVGVTFLMCGGAGLLGMFLASRIPA